MAELVEGRAINAAPLERELVALARATVQRPARLCPEDLEALRALVGHEALDFVLVAGAFHFINRIADLLHVDPEVLPARLRAMEPLRRLGVWAASRAMVRLDLRNRRYEKLYEQAVADITPTFQRTLGRRVGNDFEPVRSRPKIVDVIRLAIEERERSGLQRSTIARIHRVVEDALPRDREDAEGFHPRPTHPIDAFAFVGTRYAARTTREMIERLRSQGYDDAGILSLAIAVADANQWARMSRLLGLDPKIFSLAEESPPVQQVA